MNQEIKKLWVDALESGEYQQVQKRLRTPLGHCCLGVLCDLYHKITGKGKWEKLDYGDESDIPVLFKFDPQSPNDFFEVSILPRTVIDWAGLGTGESRHSLQRLTVDGQEHGLTGLNDDGVSFKEIAKLIREQL